MLTISHIYIYPIKSMGGISLKACRLDGFGLQYDRRWMVVDAEGNFLTQRQHAQMCFFKVSMLNDGLQITHKQLSDVYIKVPFEPITNTRIKVKVWTPYEPYQNTEYKMGKSCLA